ncbi:MAG: hypothetical protein PHR77_11510 [Kiritimatiellae bacterium]|nr:hypothetical protein [Kiritimatiellia bacterium]MDD5519917.1 hypothetical protein [Kiritimatiellia bacterium]
MKNSTRRPFIVLLTVGIVCLFSAVELNAWDAQPHRFITASAWNVLPEKEQQLLDTDRIKELSQTYSLLPDLWRDCPSKREPWMENCIKSPKGIFIHGGLLPLLKADKAQGYQETERWLLEQLINAIRSRNAETIARWAGVITHDIEDTFAVGHAMNIGITPSVNDLYKRVKERYEKMGFRMDRPGTLRLIHFDSLPEMEKSWPGIPGYKPRVLGKNLDEATRNILTDWITGIRESAAVFEKLFPLFIKPGSEDIKEWKDFSAAEQAEAHRILHTCTVTAAKLLADVYHTAFFLASSPGS